MYNKKNKRENYFSKAQNSQHLLIIVRRQHLIFQLNVEVLIRHLNFL